MAETIHNSQYYWRTMDETPPLNTFLLFKGARGKYFVGIYEYYDSIKKKHFGICDRAYSTEVVKWCYIPTE